MARPTLSLVHALTECTQLAEVRTDSIPISQIKKSQKFKDLAKDWTPNAGLLTALMSSNTSTSGHGLGLGCGPLRTLT